MICAIHQPNFFPWLGFFDKIRRADVFVFLDAVAYPRAGSSGMGSWCNRVRVSVQGEEKWITCPVRRSSLGTPIQDILIDESQLWRERLLRTLESNYRRAPRYAESMRVIEPLIRMPESNLAAFNILAITSIAKQLGLSTQFVRQSALKCSGKATALLVSLLESVGASVYLAGGGAVDYQNDMQFQAHNLDVLYQNFIPGPYGDPSRFIPGLSVIDYLMWDGRPLAEWAEEYP